MADLDEDFYVDESFEDDSQSDIEEQEDEAERDKGKNDDDDDDEDNDDDDDDDDEDDDDDDDDDDEDDDDNDNDNEDDDEDSATLEDSEDTEADPKVEFLLGNVSREAVPQPPQERTIKEFSLDSKTNALSHPQPHARRQLLRAFAGARGNNRKMPAYSSSSSDEESQVVITKTVAEVNSLALGRDASVEDGPESARTLKPGSARVKEDVDISGSDEEVDDEEEEDKMKYGDDIEILEEDEEGGEEEEVEDQAEYSESDGAVDSDEEAHESPDKDIYGTDVEVDQLELEEDEETHQDPDPEEPETKTKTDPRTIVAPAAHNGITVEDASDNSSECSTKCPRKASPQGYETDITLIDDKHPSQLPLEAKLEAITELEIEIDTETETMIETDTKTKPVIEPQNLINDLTKEQLAAAMPPMSQLEQFISEMNMNVPDSNFMMAPDMAAVKLLERQMTQMSAIIMRSIRMNGGAASNRSLDGPSMPTDMLRERSPKVEDPGVESTTESSLTSARSCDTGDTGDTDEQMRTKGVDHRDYEENMSSVGSRSHCRCPSTTDCMETDPEPETVMDAAFYMDECGQGDGLMRHPHQRRPPEFQHSLCSVTPSSFTSDGFARIINVPRSRSSTEKINYKNLGRKSFSFTNAQMREIERQNQILLRKMMTVKPTATIKASTSAMKCNNNATSNLQPPAAARLSSAAVNRKKYQRQIDLENDLIKRKLNAIHTRRPLFK